MRTNTHAPVARAGTGAAQWHQTTPTRTRFDLDLIKHESATNHFHGIDQPEGEPPEPTILQIAH